MEKLFKTKSQNWKTWVSIYREPTKCPARWLKVEAPQVGTSLWNLKILEASKKSYKFPAWKKKKKNNWFQTKDQVSELTPSFLVVTLDDKRQLINAFIMRKNNFQLKCHIHLKYYLWTRVRIKYVLTCTFWHTGLNKLLSIHLS